jgi:hypothetical protein
MFSQGSDDALPVTAGRAKRENGGLGEDPPGSTITRLQVRTVRTDIVNKEHILYTYIADWPRGSGGLVPQERKPYEGPATTNSEGGSQRGLEKHSLN